MVMVVRIRYPKIYMIKMEILSEDLIGITELMEKLFQIMHTLIQIMEMFTTGLMINERSKCETYCWFWKFNY